MLKKIIFTFLVILLIYLVVRWRQKKAVEVAVAKPQAQNTNTSIYYLAGAVITLMIVSVLFWFSIQ